MLRAQQGISKVNQRLSAEKNANQTNPWLPNNIEFPLTMGLEGCSLLISIVFSPPHFSPLLSQIVSNSIDGFSEKCSLCSDTPKAVLPEI